MAWDAEAKRKTQAAQLAGIANDGDLFRAAAGGALGGLSDDDRNYWQAHVDRVSDKSLNSTRFVNNPSQRSFVGHPGGLTASNEPRLVRLLTQYQAQRPA